MTRSTVRQLDAAKIFLIALWAVCVYRAVTQSIVHDEALTWEIYLAGPAGAIFTFFDANHHFLNTVLMRVSTGLLGLSEFSMRAPALCAAALYFVAVYRLARRTVSGRPRVLLAVAVMTLNPIVLDFMVAARGYGMALALWMWAFQKLVPVLKREAVNRRDLLEAAAALSLSVAANLTFLFPAGLLAICAVVLLRQPSQRLAGLKRPPKSRAKKVTVGSTAAAPPAAWRWFVLPIVVGAVLFCLVAPIDVARSADFYAGTQTLPESLRSLASMSLLYGRWLRTAPYITLWRDMAAFILAPAIVAAALVVGILRRDMLLLVPALVAAGSALLLAAGHLLTGMPWPMDRTGIYFPVLVTLMLVFLARRWSRPAAWIAVAFLVVLFAAQFNVRSFYVWQYDADTRTIASRIAENRTSGAPESVGVGGSWQLAPALNFYRVRNGWTWMKPVERRPIAPGTAFYAFIAADTRAIQILDLRTLYVGQESGTVLAAASQ